MDNKENLINKGLINNHPILDKKVEDWRSELLPALKEQEVEPQETGYFEVITSLSLIDEKKLSELQQPDTLVCIYRDNYGYQKMNEALKNLLEKREWRVYSISIQQGTETLNDADVKLLKKILRTCRCLTDGTVSHWADLKSSILLKLDHKISEMSKIINLTSILEEKFIEKWINTIYICVSSLADHGIICQNEEWKTYFVSDNDAMRIRYWYWKEKGLYIEKDEDKYKELIEDWRRFRKNVFPNTNVQFIEKEDFVTEHDYIFDPNKYDANHSVLIGDNHVSPVLNKFSWLKIFLSWDVFTYWLENFLGDDYSRDLWRGDLMAKMIIQIANGEIKEDVFSQQK